MDREKLKEIVLSQKKRIRSAEESFIDRQRYPQLSEFLPLPHAVVVMGVRRCGKSTLLNQFMQEHFDNQFFHLNFEDERLLSFTVNDFEILYEIFVELFGERKAFYFDEIQNIDRWEMYVRRMQESGYKFFLTGSNASLLSKEMGTKLTGRHVDLELFPFSFHEYLQLHQWETKEFDFYDSTIRGRLYHEYIQYLQHGGFPEFLKYSKQDILIQTYEDILFRDIVCRHDIKDVKSLRELALYLITNLAKPFSYTKLKNTLGFGSVNTVKNYIQYLEDSYLLFTINQFSYSLHEQAVNNKKVYVIDNGLADVISFQFSRNKGQFLENLVFLELRRRYSDIYYYKTDNNQEIDFVILQGKKIAKLIQVADDISNEKTRKREIDALVKALSETQLNEGLLLTDHHQETLKIGNKTIVIQPVYQWLLIT